MTEYEWTPAAHAARRRAMRDQFLAGLRDGTPLPNQAVVFFTPYEVALAVQAGCFRHLGMVPDPGMDPETIRYSHTEPDEG